MPVHGHPCQVDRALRDRASVRNARLQREADRRPVLRRGFGKRNVDPSDYISPRDGDGHGSHTASTAAGNRVRDVVVDGTRFGTVSGMAPAAKVAAYKVCWTGSVERGVADGCTNSDSVAAIDQAVVDGVDVINYSIGGTSETRYSTRSSWRSCSRPPRASTTPPRPETPVPVRARWTTRARGCRTTAASTHRIAEKKLVLGNGRQFIGASTTSELPNLTPMVMAEDSGAAGVDRRRGRALCAPGTLDPAKVTGKLVVCIRGVVDRIEKSFDGPGRPAASAWC